MKRITIQWKLVMPVSQLILAISLWLYIPLQFGHEMIRAMKLPSASFGRSVGLPPEVFTRFYPPSSGRLLYALDLPAAALSAELESHVYTSMPAWEFTWPLRDPNGIVYVIGLRELAFFVGVVLLWLWAGSKIDESIQRRRGPIKSAPKAWRMAEMLMVFGLGALLLCTSLICILDKKCPPPQQQIWTFGLVWPVLLFAYVGISLHRELRGKVALIEKN